MEGIFYYLMIVFSSALFCIGLVILLKTPFFTLAKFSTSQLNVILDTSLKEEEKDKLLLRNLTKILGYLFLCLVVLFLLGAIAVLIPVLYLELTGQVEADTSSLYFYLCMIAGSFSLFLFKKKGNYSYWSKLLHTIVLDNYALGMRLLDRELKKDQGAEPREDQDFLIITGLARSGTTALTNLIFEEKNFHSINYSNVPFLLAPNLWKRIYNPRKIKERERAHQDSILFSEASIEALEEYFFKAHLRDDYISDNYLEKHTVSKELLTKYYRYQSLFKKTDNTTYLAKNNNFLLRYESIRKLNKRFHVILIFRDPLDHAQSLLNQHKNFLDQQNDDSFVLSYMTWLGHYEFGLNHKHFHLRESNLYPESDTKNELSFWLQVWINYYSYVTEIYTPDQNLFLVHYEDLANNPNGLKKAIGIKIGKELDTESAKPFRKNKPAAKTTLDENDPLLKKAYEVYHKLVADKIQVN